MFDESKSNPYASPHAQLTSGALSEITFTKAQQAFLIRALWTMRVIVVSLALGIVFFAAIVALMPAPADAGDRLLSFVAAVFAATALAAANVVPRQIAARGCRRIAAGTGARMYSPFVPADVGVVGQLVMVFQTQLLIGAALLEGAVFMCLVTYMIEGQAWTLGIVAALFVLILAKFPMRARLESWVAQQLAAMQVP